MAKPNPIIHIKGLTLHNLGDEELRKIAYHSGFPEINHLHLPSDVNGKVVMTVLTIWIATATRHELVMLLASHSGYRPPTSK